jgi:hypothetical protein
VRTIDDPHSAFAQLRQDSIGTDVLADHSRVLCRAAARFS